jgi:hypothetical protein
MIAAISNDLVPPIAYCVDTINYKDSFPALCRGGKVLWGAKVPKALCQSCNVASHHPTLIKKTEAIVLLVSAQ